MIPLKKWGGRTLWGWHLRAQLCLLVLSLFVLTNSLAKPVEKNIVLHNFSEVATSPLSQAPGVKGTFFVKCHYYVPPTTTHPTTSIDAVLKGICFYWSWNALQDTGLQTWRRKRPVLSKGKETCGLAFWTKTS